MGREYSFGSGGGIFESTPREAGGAPFRLQLDMGSYEGGSKELNRALDDLRSSGFGNSDYNLIYKNFSLPHEDELSLHAMIEWQRFELLFVHSC